MGKAMHRELRSGDGIGSKAPRWRRVQGLRRYLSLSVVACASGLLVLLATSALGQTVEDQEAARQALYERIADSDRWELVYLQSNVMVAFDRTRTTLNAADGVVTAWIRWDHQPPRKQDVHPYKDVHHSVRKMQIDCRGMRSRERAWAEYDQDGQVLASSDSDEWTRWSDWLPDSIGESSFGLACDIMRAKNAKPKRK
jgi:hypothetical protein